MKPITQETASCLNCGAAILTPKEAEFLAFLQKKYHGKTMPIHSQIARDFGIDRRRVFQLMGRLIEKGIELNGKGQSLSARQK